HGASCVNDADAEIPYLPKLLNYGIVYRISFKKLPMNIDNKLGQLKSRYEELTVALGDPSVYGDQKRFAGMSKEHSELGDLMKVYDRLLRVRSDIAGNRELMASEKDPDLLALAREEQTLLLEETGRLEEEIRIMLV